MTAEQREAIEQLRDRKAAKRESAANKLARKPCPEEAGPALLEALKAELEDDRTWKAKTAQAWALACNPHPPALGLLLDIAGDDLGGSAVNDCVGSAAVACGREDPGPDEVLLALVGDEDDVPTDRLAAVVGGLEVLACPEPPQLDDALVERLLAIAEEDPPETVPHGVNRRHRVFQLRHRLLDVAGGLSSEHRERLIALADATEDDENSDDGWEKSLAAARELG